VQHLDRNDPELAASGAMARAKFIALQPTAHATWKALLERVARIAASPARNSDLVRMRAVEFLCALRYTCADYPVPAANALSEQLVAETAAITDAVELEWQTLPPEFLFRYTHLVHLAMQDVSSCLLLPAPAINLLLSVVATRSRETMIRRVVFQGLALDQSLLPPDGQLGGYAAEFSCVHLHEQDFARRADTNIDAEFSGGDLDPMLLVTMPSLRVILAARDKVDLYPSNLMVSSCLSGIQAMEAYRHRSDATQVASCVWGNSDHITHAVCKLQDDLQRHFQPSDCGDVSSWS
jgi:hypothetical protein